MSATYVVDACAKSSAIYRKTGDDRALLLVLDSDKCELTLYTHTEPPSRIK